MVFVTMVMVDMELVKDKVFMALSGSVTKREVSVTHYDKGTLGVQIQIKLCS